MSDPERPSPPRSLLGLLATLSAAVPVLRPGTSVPAAAPSMAGAPAPSAPSVRRGPPGRLRTSLRASLAEGMVAEVVTAFATGTVLTGWALHLRFGPLMVGILGALPIVAQVFHLPAAWLTGAVGRRRLAILASTASRLVYLALPLVWLLEAPPAVSRAVFLAVAGISAVLAVVANNAWVAWMGDLVPASIRGRFFGRRMAATTFAGTLAVLAAGAALDLAAPRGLTGAVLSALAATAGAAGFVSMLLMLRQHDPGGEARSHRFDLQATWAPLQDARARGLVRYQLVWNAAVGVSASFFALHMLVNLEMGFVLTALYGAWVALVRILAAPAWGRAIDRLGARPVLLATSLGISVVPLLWLFPTPGHLWPLVFEGVLAGAFWSGQQLAVFELPLAVAPRPRRPYYLAVFAGAAGLGFGVASVLGGALAELLPEVVRVGGRALADLQVLFVISAVARAGAAFLALGVAGRARAAAPTRLRPYAAGGGVSGGAPVRSPSRAA